MILVVGGVKGGCGKTTIATNLTVLRSSQKKKVLLVDADEQNTASDWAATRVSLGIPTEWTTIRLSGKSIDFQIEKLRHDFDDIIIDVGGRDTTSQRSALLIADVLLLPFKPRSFDVWTLGKVKSIISEIKTINKKLICLAVINEADPKGSDNDEAKEILAESDEIKCLPISIGRRKSFGNAGSDGLGVSELKTQDKKAIQEIQSLLDFIYTTHI